MGQWYTLSLTAQLGTRLLAVLITEFMSRMCGTLRIRLQSALAACVLGPMLLHVHPPPPKNRRAFLTRPKAAVPVAIAATQRTSVFSAPALLLASCRRRSARHRLIAAKITRGTAVPIRGNVASAEARVPHAKRRGTAALD